MGRATGNATGLTPIQIHRKNVENLLGKTWMERLPPDFQDKNENELDISMLDSARVCKSYLVGKCIYEELENTKENLGKCPKLHMPKYRLIYETAKEKGIPMPNQSYELDYMADLAKIVKDCDNRVRVAKERLDYSFEDKQLLNQLEDSLDLLDSKIGVLVQELNGSENVTIKRRIQINEELSRQVREKEGISQQYSSNLERLNTIGEQKLQVCEICGGYMSKIDNDKRLVDHFIGKIHLTYADVRRSLEELKVKYEQNRDMRQIT